MGYFPTVSKGDKVTPTAAFHNAVVNTVNYVRGDPKSGVAPLSRTRITLPVLAAEDIEAGSPVELVGEEGFAWKARSYLVRQARSQASAIGILRDDIRKDYGGSVTIAGLELINIPDSSTGDYATMTARQDGRMVFTRTTTPTPYRILDSLATTQTRQVAHILFGMTQGAAGAYDGFFALSYDQDETVFNVRGGIALVNGLEASVDGAQFAWPSGSISGSGSGSGSESGSSSGSGSASGSGSGPVFGTEGHVWLYAYVRATGDSSTPFGVGAELVYCDATMDDDDSTGPSATNIVTSSRKLIATVWDGSWRQEFITGSECNFLLLGDACE